MNLQTRFRRKERVGKWKLYLELTAEGQIIG